MTDWFRSWHGAPTDPKWRTVARRAGVRPGDVAAVVWALLDRASQAKVRGSVEGYDAEVLADALGYEPQEIEAIIAALRDKGVLDDVVFVGWSKYQPAREDGRCLTHEWAALRRQIFVRDGFRCFYCGECGGRLECDHVVPHSRGGKSDPTNLVTACFTCNRAKGNKLLSEWIRSA